jgi:hypothetical protein
MGVPFCTKGETSCFLLILICKGVSLEDVGVVGHAGMWAWLLTLRGVFEV